MKDQYTPEQIKDIQEREKSALEYLKANHLTPSAAVQKLNIGEDMFVDKVIPYLSDTKYSVVKSPLTKEDVKSEKKDK